MKAEKFKLIIILSIIFITLIVLLIFNPVKSFKIPTGSMENTILAGSRVIALKKNFIPERFEIIIYHHPDFDTLLIPDMPLGYYAAVRAMGKESVESSYEKKFVPLKKREQYIGRCVGLPGDTIFVQKSILYVNGQIYVNENQKKFYKIETERPINPKSLEKIGIQKKDIENTNETYIISATKKQIEELTGLIDIVPQEFNHYSPGEADKMIFPYGDNPNWNSEFFGKITIPKKGIKITLNLNNLSIYKRLITDFEDNEMTLQGDSIRINGILTDYYIPKMNYFFIMGDNIQNSADSRCWGFLPEDHISGKVILVL